MVEDACEALGASLDGRPVGSFGNPAVYGFYPNKQITTGEGGMITTDDPDVERELRSIVNQGRSDSGDWLVHQRLGFNFRMDEMSAAVGLAQLEKLEMMLEGRARVARRYDQLLAGVAGVQRPYDGPHARSWFIYPALMPRTADRDAVLADLSRHGIEAKAYMPCIHLLPHYRERFGLREGQFPVAEDASSRLVALPFFGAMTDEHVERVASALAAALSSV